MQFLVRGGVEAEVCGPWVEVGSESDSPSPANWPCHAAGVEEGKRDLEFGCTLFRGST